MFQENSRAIHKIISFRSSIRLVISLLQNDSDAEKIFKLCVNPFAVREQPFDSEGGGLALFRNNILTLKIMKMNNLTLIYMKKN